MRGRSTEEQTRVKAGRVEGVRGRAKVQINKEVEARTGAHWGPGTWTEAHWRLATKA